MAGSRGAGSLGEEAAEEALRKKRYRILDRNYQTPVGEIDLVARQGRCLCFVEVKRRSSTAFGHPAEAVTAEKKRRIARAAEWYLAARGARREPDGSRPGRSDSWPFRGWKGECRFDVVSVLDSEGGGPHIEIIADAFEGPYPPRRRR
jgi:putative endonuclease